MSEHPSSPDSNETAPRKPLLAGLLARFGFTHLAVALLAAAFLWLWLDSQRMTGDMQRQLAEKLAEMSAAGKASQMLLTQNQDQMRELSVKIAMLEARYAETQNQRASLEALYDDLSASRDESALAEVEQLLLIAGQQLQLSANVKAALIAMQSADARLQRMDRSAFNVLRKAIGQDMDRLRALPTIDVTGINLQLNNLIAAVDGLPLVYQQRVAGEPVEQTAPPGDETVWKRLWREFWQEARQLVRIENTGKAEIPLLPPDQEFFLRENLKLRLLAVRLALLSRDEDSYSQELNTALLWTEKYFDGKSSQGARMLTDLKRLAASSISLELPDIGTSLKAVRDYRQARERAAERRHDRKNPR